jgi:hypothetical protein
LSACWLLDIFRESPASAGDWLHYYLPRWCSLFLCRDIVRSIAERLVEAQGSVEAAQSAVGMLAKLRYALKPGAQLSSVSPIS